MGQRETEKERSGSESEQMRIFHLADCHFSDERLEHKVTAFEKCLAKIDEMQDQAGMDDVAVIAGDIFDHSLRVEDDGAQEAFRLVGELHRRMPVLLIKGNQSHDRNSMGMFDGLLAINLVTSVRPECVEFYLGDGGRWSLRKVELGKLVEKSNDNGAQCTFVTLPYPSYSFVAEVESMPSESLRAAVSERITTAIKTFRLIDRPNKILVYHGTVTGARDTESHRMVGLDIELAPYDIKDSDFEFVCGGHIHYAQEMEEAPVFYPGGLAYLTYADEGQRGMWIHSTDEGKWSHEFFNVAAPRMLTFELDLREGHHIILPRWAETGHDVDLKVKLTFREDQNIDLIREGERLRKWFPNVKSMTIDKIVERIESVRAKGVQEATTLREKVKVWAEYAGVEITESVLEKADLVESHDHEQLIEMEQL